MSVRAWTNKQKEVCSRNQLNEEKTHLKPVGNLEIDLVHSLDTVVERLDCLARLEVGLSHESAPSHSRNVVTRRNMLLTSIAGYSTRIESSMATGEAVSRTQIGLIRSNTTPEIWF